MQVPTLFLNSDTATHGICNNAENCQGKWKSVRLLKKAFPIPYPEMSFQSKVSVKFYNRINITIRVPRLFT